MNKRLLIINSFALALTIAVFTPLLAPKDANHTQLLGMPYALGMGIVVTIVFALLTWQGAVEYRKLEEEEKRSKTMR